MSGLHAALVDALTDPHNPTPRPGVTLNESELRMAYEKVRALLAENPPAEPPVDPRPGCGSAVHYLVSADLPVATGDAGTEDEAFERYAEAIHRGMWGCNATPGMLVPGGVHRHTSDSGEYAAQRQFIRNVLTYARSITGLAPATSAARSSPEDAGERVELSEDKGDDDGPECETCGKTSCPDADLPSFSAPRRCAYKPIYEAIRDAKDCDYGCARDLTNQQIRLYVVPAVERIIAGRPAVGR